MKEHISEYFQNQDIFQDCMLLEYHYEQKDSTFIWVGRPGYFFKVDWSMNPFIKIHFKGVSGLKHEFPDSPAAQLLAGNYATFCGRDHKGVYMAHQSYLLIDQEQYRIEIEMTTQLGSIFFNFILVEVEILFTNYKAINGDHVYFHRETNEQIDFYHPFGRIN